MAIEITNPPAWPKESVSAGANMGTRSVLGSAGVGLASSAADSALGAVFNQVFAKRNAKMQSDMWKKLFDYQAEYNSPVNQLKRLYEAGINPLYNSEYGGSQSFQGGISSLPEQIGNGSFGENLERFLALMLENRKIDLTSERNKAENARDYASAKDSLQNAKLTEIRSQNEYDTAVANIRAIEAQTDKTNEEINLVRAQVSQCFSFMRAKRNEVLQNWNYVFQSIRRNDIDFFTSRWQKEQGAMARETDREQVDESVRHNKVMERYESVNIKQAGMRLENDIRHKNWSAVRDMIKDCQSSIAGYKLEASQSDIEKMLGAFSALTSIPTEELSDMPLDIGNDALEFLGDVVSFGAPIGAAKAAPAVGKLGVKTLGKKIVGNSTWKRAFERAVQ